MKKKLISAILSLVLIAPSIAIATDVENPEVPKRARQEVHISGSLETGEVVSENYPDIPVSIASTTKVMTYLVIKDLISEGKGSLEDQITISANAANTEGSTFNLKEGERVSVQILLEAMMIVSANDATVALAEYFANTTDEFVKLMNIKAEELNLSESKFYTVNGLESADGNENTMTARELFNLSAHTIKKYPEILEITNKVELDVPERNFREANSNGLLGVLEGIDGLKTGYTDTAGRCLIATGKLTPEASRVASVVMGTDSIERRDQQSSDLIRQMYEDYEKRLVYHKNKVIGREALNQSKYVKADLVLKEDVYIFSRNDEAVNSEIIMMKEVPYPIVVGDTVGKLILTYGNNKREFDLTSSENIGRLKRVALWLKGFFESSDK